MLRVAAVALLGCAAGATLATNHPRYAAALLVVPALGVALTVRVELVFLGWLLAAPVFQGAASGNHFGHLWFKYLFLAPPLLMLLRMALGSARVRRLWVVDLLPVLYFGYILASARLFPSPLASTAHTTPTAIYIHVGVGVIAYYVAAFATTSERFPERLAAVLLWGGCIVAVLAVVDGLTGTNIWNHAVIGGDNVRRAVSTFSSPEEVGAYLGAGVAFALAALLWKGPASLRLPALALLGAAIPALYFTYTRGPALAIAGVGVLMALIARRTRWPSLLVFATVGIVLFASWGHISSTTVYKNRLGNAGTVEPRVALSDVALHLFRQRPIFGYGYATFDQAKLNVPVPPGDTGTVSTLTSHDTYLTILAESGVVGLALLVVPWIAIAFRALAAGRRGLVEPWIVAGCLGAAAAFAIGAGTYDARFFPLITSIPWIALGLARKLIATVGPDAQPRRGPRPAAR